MALYSAAAAVLEGLERGDGGVKSLVFNSRFPVRAAGRAGQGRAGRGGGPRGRSVPGGEARGGRWRARSRPPRQRLTTPQHVRQLYALVSETLRYSPVLEKLLAGAALLQAEKKLPPQLAKVRPAAGASRGPGPRPRGHGAGLTLAPAGAGVRPALRQGPEVRGTLEGAGPAAPAAAGGRAGASEGAAEGEPQRGPAGAGAGSDPRR